MIKINEREVVVYALMDILDSGAYNNITLRRILNKNNAMQQMQKNFVTELVNGVIRNLIYIDYVINQYSKTNTEKMKPLILNILRAGAYQLLFMDKVPDSAVCNEAVKLAKSKGFVNLSGFVNGVLRNISRGRDSLTLPSKADSPLQYLSLKYSFPEWLIKMWLEQMQFAELESMLQYSAQAPDVTICVNKLKSDTNGLAKSLAEANVQVRQGKFAEEALHLKQVSDIAQMREFTSGLFHVMDESSMRAVMMLAPQPGDVVIDACAAPGGKSFYAAELMENTGKIIANDVYEHKIKLIDDGAVRLGINIINAELGDAAVYDEKRLNTADKLLIDAPCSGLGLIRKKPDIKYTKQPEDIKTLARLQRDILSACSGYLKIGGVMVYSTCTVSQEENMNNIQWFVNNFKYRLDRHVQLVPSEDVVDGFFIARLIREG